MAAQTLMLLLNLRRAVRRYIVLRRISRHRDCRGALVVLMALSSYYVRPSFVVCDQRAYIVNTGPFAAVMLMMAPTPLCSPLSFPTVFGKD